MCSTAELRLGRQQELLTSTIYTAKHFFSTRARVALQKKKKKKKLCWLMTVEDGAPSNYDLLRLKKI